MTEFEVNRRRKEIEAQGVMIAEIVARAQKRISEIEGEMFRLSMGALTGDSAQRLNSAKRVVLALETRLKLIYKMLNNPDNEAFMRGYKSFSTHLTVPYDPMTSVVGSAQFPPLAPEQWQETVEGLLAGIKFSVAKNSF
ncbi:hypothetical protein BVY02_00665 [bacterium J17]|nr:hypothetical protein BVY02_00665 [bacterium J17]